MPAFGLLAAAFFAWVGSWTRHKAVLSVCGVGCLLIKLGGRISGAGVFLIERVDDYSRRRP